MAEEKVMDKKPAEKDAKIAEAKAPAPPVEPRTAPPKANETKAPKAVAPKKKVPPKAAAPKQKTVGKSDIGIGVKPPAKVCNDDNCPFHGRLPVRGQIFEGMVVADKMDKSAVILRERMLFIPKYERFLKRTSRMSVHSPPCIEAKAGDWVTVMECRPLSKTIAFTIVSKKTDAKARTEQEG